MLGIGETANAEKSVFSIKLNFIDYPLFEWPLSTSKMQRKTENTCKNFENVLCYRLIDFEFLRIFMKVDFP